ncbi:TPA: hypothetical protein RW282_004697 [Escherichia coli]|uniref:hypothetical protein n=1 Tax=Escherichia coli TaxID=562 RepID=UPI0005A5FF82|nr:hypothetical protein [Escherichia coli]EFN7203012.1 hypothetical protein [Escherichia coli]GCN50810.1 hypothetical protein ExPECSC022_02940 [Escherichia coli]HDS2944978.1 hypothetical protein [Escherichia coli]HDW0050335.1 hypothetical protein [Escherichia coli]HDZ8277904.1 hypothetical protein [Escherichia coli]
MNRSIFSRLNNKVFLAMLTSSVFSTGCAISAIWFYLQGLGRLDLFFDSIDIKFYLSVIFVFILLSLMALTSLIFISSHVLVYTYTWHKDYYKNHKGIAHRIAIICYINSIVFYFSLVLKPVLSAFSEEKSLYPSISEVILIVLFNYFVSYFLSEKLIFTENTPREQNIENHENHERYRPRNRIRYTLPLCLILPGLVQIIPLLFLINKIRLEESAGILSQFLSFSCIAFAFIFLGMLPGVIVINEQEEKQEGVNSLLSIAIFPPAILFILSILFKPIPDIIINMTMSMSGISDWRPHQYYIDVNKYSYKLFDPQVWNTRLHQDIPGIFFITGVNVFSLGDTDFICPVKILPARNESLKDTPLNSEEYYKQIYKVQQIAMSCIIFHKGDVHLWDSYIQGMISVNGEKITDSDNNSDISSLK